MQKKRTVQYSNNNSKQSSTLHHLQAPEDPSPGFGVVGRLVCALDVCELPVIRVVRVVRVVRVARVVRVIVIISSVVCTKFFHRRR